MNLGTKVPATKLPLITFQIAPAVASRALRYVA